MTDKKVVMNEEELNGVAGGNSLEDAMQWFKKKYDEIVKKNQEKKKNPLIPNVPTKPDHVIPDFGPEEFRR